MAAYTFFDDWAAAAIYTGWTDDVGKRVAAHNSGHGAKYTRARRPVELVYTESFDTKEEAMSREWHIKQLSRAAKLALIDKEHETPYNK